MPLDDSGVTPTFAATVERDNVATLPTAGDVEACAQSVRIAVTTLARHLHAAGEEPANAASTIRSIVDSSLDAELAPTLIQAEMPASDRAVLAALARLEDEPGAPIRTTRAGLAVEANVRPITLDCTLYRLERDGVIRRNAKPGRGTEITMLRRVA